jgi:hypothetical protein
MDSLKKNHSHVQYETGYRAGSLALNCEVAFYAIAEEGPSLERFARELSDGLGRRVLRGSVLHYLQHDPALLTRYRLARSATRYYPARQPSVLGRVVCPEGHVHSRGTLATLLIGNQNFHALLKEHKITTRIGRALALELNQRIGQSALDGYMQSHPRLRDANYFQRELELLAQPAAQHNVHKYGISRAIHDSPMRDRIFAQGESYLKTSRLFSKETGMRVLRGSVLFYLDQHPALLQAYLTAKENRKAAEIEGLKTLVAQRKLVDGLEARLLPAVDAQGDRALSNTIRYRREHPLSKQSFETTYSVFLLDEAGEYLRSISRILDTHIMVVRNMLNAQGGASRDGRKGNSGKPITPALLEKILALVPEHGFKKTARMLRMSLSTLHYYAKKHHVRSCFGVGQHGPLAGAAAK